MLCIHTYIICIDTHSKYINIQIYCTVYSLKESYTRICKTFGLGQSEDGGCTVYPTVHILLYNPYRMEPLSLLTPQLMPHGEAQNAAN